MTTIEQIKSALQAHIAEAEAATPGPWEAWQELYEVRTNYVRIRTSNDVHLRDTLHGYCGRANATFIAHARTMSPAACKCLLLAIEGLAKVAYVKEDAGQPDHSFVGRTAAFAIESIRQEWHNLTTK
jgi:hypothetical protein